MSWTTDLLLLGGAQQQAGGGVVTLEASVAGTGAVAADLSIQQYALRHTRPTTNDPQDWPQNLLGSRIVRRTGVFRDLEATLSGTGAVTADLSVAAIGEPVRRAVASHHPVQRELGSRLFRRDGQAVPLEAAVSGLGAVAADITVSGSVPPTRLGVQLQGHTNQGYTTRAVPELPGEQRVEVSRPFSALQLGIIDLVAEISGAGAVAADLTVVAATPKVGIALQGHTNVGLVSRQVEVPTREDREEHSRANSAVDLFPLAGAAPRLGVLLQGKTNQGPTVQPTPAEAGMVELGSRYIEAPAAGVVELGADIAGEGVVAADLTVTSTITSRPIVALQGHTNQGAVTPVHAHEPQQELRGSRVVLGKFGIPVPIDVLIQGTSSIQANLADRPPVLSLSLQGFSNQGGVNRQVIALPMEFREPVSRVLNALFPSTTITLSTDVAGVGTVTADLVIVGAPPARRIGLITPGSTNQNFTTQGITQPPFEKKEPYSQVFVYYHAAPPIFQVISAGKTNQGWNYKTYTPAERLQHFLESRVVTVPKPFVPGLVELFCAIQGEGTVMPTLGGSINLAADIAGAGQIAADLHQLILLNALIEGIGDVQPNLHVTVAGGTQPTRKKLTGYGL